MELSRDEIPEWDPQPGKVAIYIYIFDNGKVYVGQTYRTIYSRYREHIRYNGYNRYLKNAMLSHNHSVKILEIVDKDDANSAEITYIKCYNAFDKRYGYNLTEGGDGVTMTPEIRKKIGVANSGEKNGRYGTHWCPPPETREKSRQARMKPIRCRETGKVYESLTAACKDTGATIGKINYCALGLADTTGGYTWEYVGEEVYRDFNIFSRAVTKALNAEKTREKYLDQWREQGRRTSRYNIGKHHSEETKKKIGATQKGKYISDETKKKISESVKKYYANN